MLADGDEQRNSRGVLLSKHYSVIGVGGWSLRGTCGILNLIVAERQ